MKRFSLVLAMLAILLAFGLAFVSCDNDTTSSTDGGGGGGAGTLTITDIPSTFNGKYIAFQAIIGNTEFLLGCESVTPSTNAITLVQISNGRANLPMWRANEVTAQGFTSFVRYNGNATVPGEDSLFMIFNTRTIYFDNESLDLAGVITFSSGITFSNGGATVSAYNGMVMSQ